MRRAIIKKDLRALITNKRQLIPLLAVPIVVAVVVPSVFILLAHFSPQEMMEMEKLAAFLPPGEQTDGTQQVMLWLLINNIMPAFFLLIPVMVASVSAASSFVGEKEKHTLETLLYCPLPLRGVFQSKILASFTLSMLVSLCSFAAMLLVAEAELLLTLGSPVFPGINWLVTLLFVAPAISLFVITLIVRGSAKAQTADESQQRTIFLILPVMAFIITQFSGMVFASAWLLLGVGAAFALLAGICMRGVPQKISYETLLKR
jgi:ABC-type Na+ efflux pump permease subunit